MNERIDEILRPLTHLAVDFGSTVDVVRAKQQIEALINKARLNEATVARHRIKHSPVETLIYLQDQRIAELTNGGGDE